MRDFIDYSERLRSVSINHRFMVYILFSVIVFLSFAIAYLSTHHDVYLVPYNLDKKVRISVRKVSPEYLTSIGLSDAAIYFNIDKENVTMQTDIFLSRLYPGLGGSFLERLKERSSEVTEDDIEQVFYPSNYAYQKDSDTVFIEGRVDVWSAGKKIESKRIGLSIHYIVRNGYALINRWDYKNV